MASNSASLKTKGSINLCCVQWKAKLTKTEEKRNALRQGVEILKGQIDRLLLENANLKTAFEEERTRLNAVEEEKQKETSCRISIEKEIAALKSEICSTKHEVASGHADSNEEVTHLQACISEREVEIDHLKQLLDAEKMAVELAKKNATELQKSLENEKCKAGEATKLAAAASREAEDCKNQLETLKSEAEKTKLVLDEVSIKFEAEKQNAIKEKRCNGKRIQEEEFRANTLQKKLEEEKQKVEKLQKEMQDIMSSKKPADSRELDEVKRKLEAEKKKVAKVKKRVEEEKARVVEQRMVAEVNEKKAAEEKCRAEKLLMQLEEEKQKIGNYQREMQDHLLSHKAVNLSQLDELTKNLEEEKKKVSQVQTYVEEEKVRVMEQRRIAEANEKRVAEEKCRADKLLMQLDEEKQKVEKYEREKQDLLLSNDAIYSSELDELKRNLEEEKEKVFQLQRQVDEEKASVMQQRMIVEANEKRVAEEKCHAGKLQMQLEEEKQKMEKYQMEMQDVLLSHKAVNSSELEEIKRILEEEKKKVTQAQRHVEEGNARVAEKRRIAEANENRLSEEKCRADKLLLQFEEQKEKAQNLQGELQKVSSSQKSAHASEAADVYRKLKAEKKKFARESKRADLEMSRKEEQKKLAEISIKNAMEEKSRADKLFEELGSSRETIDKLERELNKVNDLLEAVRKEVASDKMCEDVQMIKSDKRGKIAVENEMRSMEKCQGDSLLKELEVARQKLRSMEHELQEAKLSRGSPAFVVDGQAARISLLQEQLKFEKKRVKHAKEVARLDKGRNKILQQELQRLTQDFQCLLDHLSVLSYNFGGRSGVTSLPKKSGQSQIHFCGEKELRMSTLSSMDASCLFKQNMHIGQAGLGMESTSGMENELDPLQGGSHGDNIPSYALNSNTASFSDEHLMGSQERVAGPRTMTASLSAENTDQQAMMLKCSNECYKQKSAEKAGISGEHIIKSPVETGVGRTKKRRKIFDEFESIKYMHFEGKRIFEEAEKKMFSLQNTLLGPMLNERKEKESLLLPTNITNFYGNFGESCKKMKPLCESQILQQANDSSEHILVDEVIAPSTTETKENSQSLSALDRDGVKEVQGALKSFEQVINEDYMKLLDLDDTVAEECFRMAMERPLSPILPEFDLHDFGQKVGTQTPTVSTSEAVHQHQFSVHDKNQLYFVLFSDMEVGSITRILGATKACVSRCLFLQKDWSLHHMLEALMLEKDLSSREKACVLFSLMLLNFSAVSSFKLVDFHSKELMDSFSAHIHTVLFDHDARVLCAKVCDLRDLLSLSDDLITNRKILSNNDLAYESLTGCDSSIEIMHEGELIVLRPMMASTTLVVAATVVLASLCKAVGHIGLVCEISLKILQMGRAEYSLALTVLHGFADICGEEYITNCNFSLVMKVVKSVVTFMEGTLAKNANKDLQLDDTNTQHQFTQCVRCPFSEDTVSLDDISSDLLVELQRHVVPQNPAVLAHSLNSEALSCVLGDVLSSLELIASIMCWDWICDKVIPNLYKMLESSHQENRVFSTALIVLLGFIGRLGVEARGYDDAGVKGIKHQLSCLLHQTSVAKYDPTLSMAIVYELIGLYPKGHEMFQKGNYVELLSEDGHSPSSSSIVSKFLSSLSSEQITSFSTLLKSITGLHA